MAKRIKSYKELRVYQECDGYSYGDFSDHQNFPPEEKYSLVDQIRRSSRSVCTNIAEAWGKRRYKAASIAKLSDSETEACETQVLIEFSYRCQYINSETSLKLDRAYRSDFGANCSYD